MDRSNPSVSIPFLHLGKLLLALAWLMAASTVCAQDVGSVIVVSGAAEIGRNGAWAAAVAGAAVQAGDELRTGTPGRLRIIFQDDSLLDLGPGVDLTVDEQVFDPASATFRTRLRLLQGKLRALVSEYYRDRRALYEIETPTAVAGVRGTEFLITYDPVADTTEIVGVSGRVQVNSLMDRVGRKVFVTSREVTSVQRGEFPAPPKRMDESTFRQYLEGVTMSRAPRPQTVAAVQQPVLAGAAVPASERAAAPPPSKSGGAATTSSSTTGTTTTAQTAESRAAPQTVEVHTTETQATSPQTTGSTAGTIQTAQQITSVQTTSAQTTRAQDSGTASGGAQPNAMQSAETTGGRAQGGVAAPAVKQAAGVPAGETQATGAPPGAAPPVAVEADAGSVEGGTVPPAEGGPAGETAQGPSRGSADGEVLPEEAEPEESEKEEAATSESGGTQVSEAQPGQTQASGAPPAESSPAESTHEVQQPMAAAEPVPFLTGPGASATLPEPLNASNLVGSPPSVVQSRGRLRIRVF